MASSTAEYIEHHLTNLTYGQFPDGSWGFAHSAEEAASMGFWAFHVDSLGWSIGLGLLFCFVAFLNSRGDQCGTGDHADHATRVDKAVV